LERKADERGGLKKKTTQETSPDVRPMRKGGSHKTHSTKGVPQKSVRELSRGADSKAGRLGCDAPRARRKILWVLRWSKNKKKHQKGTQARARQKCGIGLKKRGRDTGRKDEGKGKG